MRKTGSNDIYTELKRRIIEIEYEPGAAIVEKEIAESFGVSRTPIREALIMLNKDGLLDVVPRQGTYVSQIDLVMVKHAYEVKKNLEGLAAELAAQRATDKEINELFEIISRFEKYDLINDYKSCIKDDQRFHQIVRTASRNPMLNDMLDELNTKTSRFLQYIHYVIEDYDWFASSLKEMAEAISNRDKEKARLETERHTKKFLEQLSKRFFQ